MLRYSCVPREILCLRTRSSLYLAELKGHMIWLGCSGKLTERSSSWEGRAIFRAALAMVEKSGSNTMESSLKRESGGRESLIQSGSSGLVACHSENVRWPSEALPPRCFLLPFHSARATSNLASTSAGQGGGRCRLRAREDQKSGVSLRRRWYWRATRGLRTLADLKTRVQVRLM